MSGTGQWAEVGLGGHREVGQTGHHYSNLPLLQKGWVHIITTSSQAHILAQVTRHFTYKISGLLESCTTLFLAFIGASDTAEWKICGSISLCG